MHKSIIWLADVDTESTTVGKQTKQIAKLTQAKFPLPPGFVITSGAYFLFLKENKLDHKIKQLLSTIAIDRPDSLMQGEQIIKRLFQQAKLSDEFINELHYFYTRLHSDIVIFEAYTNSNHNRKLATLQTENISQLAEQVKKTWAEMFSGNALWNRKQHRLNHIQTGVEIIVQKRIGGAKKGSVITVDPKSTLKDKLIITVKHPHEGDHYILSKKNLTIIDRSLHNTAQTQLEEKLSHDELLTIAKTAKELEEFLYFPQEITWAFEDGLFFIMKALPYNSLPKPEKEVKKKLPLARGKGYLGLIRTGIVHVISSPSDFKNIKEHDILILPEITINQLNHIKKVRGIITEANHPHSAVTLLLRHHGIPAIFHVTNATRNFHNGYHITLNASKGEIYKGGFL